MNEEQMYGHGDGYGGGGYEGGPAGHSDEPEWAQYLEDRVNQLEEFLGQMAEMLQGQGQGGGDPQHSEAMNSMSHMVRQAAQHQLVQHIAGDLSPQAQQFMHGLLGSLEPQHLAGVYQSPHALALLKRAAQAEHHDSSGPGTAAPRGEDVWNAGGNIDPEAQKEIEAYLKAFGPQGVTPDMAVAAYRRATGGR